MESEVDIPELMDLPPEILQKVFNHLDDVTLLKARQVSKQFKMHTEEGVRTKYGDSKSSYHIDISQNVENEEQHIPFIHSFGGFISAIEVAFNDIQISPENRTIRLLKQKCSMLSMISLKSTFAHISMDLESFLVDFPNFSTLKLNGLNPNDGWERHSYTNLRCIEFRCMDLTMPILRSFFLNNPQVTHFTLGGLAGITIDVFDGTNLEILCCDEQILFGNFFIEEVMFINDLSRVNIPSLSEIAIGNECSNLLEVIGAGCRNLQTFTVYQIMHAIELNAAQLNIISSLRNLLVIKMNGFIFDAHQIKHIIRKLPHLNEMQFTLENPTVDDIKGIVIIANNHLKLLGINLQNAPDEDQLLSSALHFWFNQSVTNGLELHLKLRSGKIVITKEKLMKNGELMHWIGLNNEIGRSNHVDLMSVEDNCLEKIIDYLDFKGKLSFYQTCNKMKRIIQPKLCQQSIYVHQNISVIREYLHLFGKFVSKIIADLSPSNDTQTICEMIYEYGRDHLNELILKGDSANFVHHLIENQFVFSKLNTLQIARYRLDLSAQNQLDFGIVFNHLTTLRFDHYNDSVLKFLRALNENVCHNLRELSIMSLKDKIPHPKNQFSSCDYQLDNAIINTIVRFHNITTLHLFMRNEFEANTKYLFEHCSNLISVSIVYDGCDEHRYITPYLRDLKRACIKLEILNLVLLEHDPEFFPGGIFAYHQLFREVRKTFPFITIKVVAAKNMRQSFDLTYKWLADFARAKCIFD